MAEKINIPGFGPANKTAVYVVGGGAAALLAYSIWKYRQNQAANAASTATGTTDTSQLDPATGYPYGSPEDAAALSSQAGYTNPYGYVGIGPNTGDTSTPIPAITDNGAWTQKAEDILVNTNGLDAPTVSAALGKYITGESVNSTEASIINQAISVANYPPQAGPSGYPPSVRLVSTPAAPALHDVVDLARLSGATNARQLVKAHSDPSASANTVEAELRLTYADPRNAPYRAYYQKTDGWWPAKAAIYVHAAKKV